jgi:hypothetical protein
MKPKPFLVRPFPLFRTYQLECPWCGCAGWHVVYDNGNILHANGVTYAASVMVARMVDLLKAEAGVRSPESKNGASGLVGEGGQL